jgi:hypothetical protein
MPKLELQMPNSYRSEITNYKHQIPNKFQISNKIKRQLFGILNLGHCDLFGICDLSIAYVKLHQFLFRFDRPFFWPAAGLNTDT